MLFEINGKGNMFDDVSFEYFNLPKNYMQEISDNLRPSEVMEPKTGLALGNLYKNEYVTYKDYVQKSLTFNNEQERMLLKIQELDFALNDLQLKLDINKHDSELYDLFKNYALSLEKLCDEYSKNYEVLELIKDVNGRYTWVNNPWPWDGGIKNV